jgi:hypothetical protein
LVLAIPLSYGMWRTERLAQADWLALDDTVEALRAASKIEPEDAAYHARIAVLDTSRRDELEAALRLNPRNPAWWIMLAGMQEQANDLAGTEKSLLKADSVCQYYTPRWMTAYYYYRQGNRAPFTKWARASMSVGAGETEPLFQMAKRMGLSPEEIAKEVVPEDPNKVAAYIDFLLGGHEPGATYQAAVKLIRLGAKDRRELIFRVCESLYESGDSGESVALWNQLVKVGWIPFQELDPETGKMLARGSFAGERTEHGFDWRYSVPQGVSVSTGDSDGSLRLEFSGKQPADCDLVSELVPLKPGRKYRLTVRYRLQGVPADSGLAWSVAAIPTGNRLATVELGKGAEASVVFEMPGKAAPVRLLLAYHRSVGTTRIEGTVWIDSVKLAPL